MSRSRDTADQINRVDSSAANATAITIDSSERLKFGTTSNTPASAGVAGIVFGDNTAGTPKVGVASFSSDGAAPVLLTRLNSDGNILGLAKDGTTVGIWRSRSGDRSTIILDPRSGGGGLSGGGAGLYPTDNAGTISDGALTLGDPAARFKDLYLSGGVYLGGTGAANKLDDYEEGTWTPVLKSDSGTPSGQVYGIQLGTYTKIGRSVHVQAYVSVTNMGSGVGGTYAQLHGLPFNIASGHQYFSSGSFPYVGALGQNVNSLHAYGQHGADYVYAMYQNGAGVSSSYLSPAGWGSAPTIMFGMTYFTDA